MGIDLKDRSNVAYVEMQKSVLDEVDELRQRIDELMAPVKKEIDRLSGPDVEVEVDLFRFEKDNFIKNIVTVVVTAIPKVKCRLTS